MPKKKKGKKDPVQLAFNSHISHYEAIRNDINLATGLQNNIVNYSTAAVAGIIAVLTFIDPEKITIDNYMWLALSFIFSMMTWASLEAEIRIHDYYSYINNVLRYRVEKLIGKTDEEYRVFDTELAGKGFLQKIRTVIRGLLGTGKFFVSLLPAIVTIWIYITTTADWSSYFIFWLAAIPILLIPFVLLTHGLYVAQYYWDSNGK